MTTITFLTVSSVISVSVMLAILVNIWSRNTESKQEDEHTWMYNEDEDYNRKL